MTDVSQKLEKQSLSLSQIETNQKERLSLFSCQVNKGPSRTLKAFF